MRMPPCFGQGWTSLKRATLVSFLPCNAQQIKVIVVIIMLENSSRPCRIALMSVFNGFAFLGIIASPPISMPGSVHQPCLTRHSALQGVSQGTPFAVTGLGSQNLLSNSAGSAAASSLLVTLSPIRAKFLFSPGLLLSMAFLCPSLLNLESVSDAHSSIPFIKNTSALSVCVMLANSVAP